MHIYATEVATPRAKHYTMHSVQSIGVKWPKYMRVCTGKKRYRRACLLLCDVCVRICLFVCFVRCFALVKKQQTGATTKKKRSLTQIGQMDFCLVICW